MNQTRGMTAADVLQQLKVEDSLGLPYRVLSLFSDMSMFNMGFGQ